MPHKRVDKDAVKRLEDDIAHAQQSIRRIEELSQFGKDAKTQFAQFLTDLAEAAAQKRDEFLRQLGVGKLSPDIQHAITWAAAQENAYKNALDVLTNPKKVTQFYEDNLVQLKELKSQYDVLEQSRG